MKKLSRSLFSVIAELLGIHKAPDYYFRKITRRSDLRQFIRRYAAVSGGNKMTLKSLLSCVSVWGYWYGDTLVGGFATNIDTPLRVFKGIVRGADQPILLAAKGIAENQLIEVCALWIDRLNEELIHDIDHQKLNMKVMEAVVEDAAQTGRTYLIAGSHQEKLLKRQRIILPIPIYRQVSHGQICEVNAGLVSDIVSRGLYAVFVA
jgi:hypothetical protein